MVYFALRLYGSLSFIMCSENGLFSFCLLLQWHIVLILQYQQDETEIVLVSEYLNALLGPLQAGSHMQHETAQTSTECFSSLPGLFKFESVFSPPNIVFIHFHFL